MQAVGVVLRLILVGLLVQGEVAAVEMVVALVLLVLMELSILAVEVEVEVTI
jgi:hypothetical protein